MKDIPVFTTENGVASLVLREIPVRGRAYIKLLSSLSPEILLKECVEFCRACGAEAIFASGLGAGENNPLSATLVEMACSGLQEPDACLMPATEETIGGWRAVYNDKMSGIPNASFMTQADEKRFLRDGDCYFVHKDGELLGIGKASGDTVEMIAAVKPGCGEKVLLAVASVLQGDTVKLTVALENEKALRLYSRLGFVPVREVSRWYKIL